MHPVDAKLAELNITLPEYKSLYAGMKYGACAAGPWLFEKSEMLNCT